jgi:hypothetical protein
VEKRDSTRKVDVWVEVALEGRRTLAQPGEEREYHVDGPLLSARGALDADAGDILIAEAQPPYSYPPPVI